MNKFLFNTEDFSVLEDDINVFLSECESTDSVWYILPHIIGNNNKISSYTALVIETTVEVDLDYLKDTYKIKPNKIYKHNYTYQYVFNLYKAIPPHDYKRAWKWLTYIIWWILVDCHFFPEYKVEKILEQDIIDKNLITFLIQFSLQIKWDDKYQQELSVHNYQEFLKTKDIPFTDILTKLKLPLVDFDSKKNIHLKFWWPFNFVWQHLLWWRKVFEFFNEEFWLDFELEEEKDNTKYTRDWVLLDDTLLKWWWIYKYSHINWYYRNDKDSNPVNITDFIIKVYYKIQQVDWTIWYIISLVNDSVESEKITLLNTTSKTLFSDFIQKQWNFHFFWNDTQIKTLHQQISNINSIPFIKQIIWYWHHEDEWIILFNNWIWDIKERIFTEKKDWEMFYFNYNYKWYYVVDKHWNDLTKIIKDWVPQLNVSGDISVLNIFKFVNKLYKDDTWEFLIYIILWLFWYLLHWDKRDPFPFIFAKWITATWKTSFNELILKAFWIKSKWSDFSNITLFVLTAILSYMIKFPIYLWEYRRDWLYVDSKDWILRSAFDRKSQPKWKADQTIITYDYYANVIMDWEEISNDWAVKSRTIQRNFIKTHKIEWNFNQIVKNEWEILDWLLYNYLVKSKAKKYEEWYNKGIDIFHNKINSRVWENFAKIYAWCYSFLPEKYLDKCIEVLKDSFNYQLKDFEEDWTSQQIIKAIEKYLNTPYCSWVYTTKNVIIISWNWLEEYISKFRLKLTLNVDTYKDHIISLWYKIDYVDVWDRLVYGVIIPYSDIPREFETHPDICMAKKQFLFNKKNKKWE